MSPLSVALVAVASSLATVGTIELLRGSPSGSQQALAIEPPPGSADPGSRGVGHLDPPPRDLDPPTDVEDRLAELERRLAALELSSRRAPVTSDSDELPEEEALRDLVLDWVAEEREARRLAEELEGAAAKDKEREFNARFRAHMLALEHDLADWQEDKLVEVFIEVQVRSEEIEAAIDVLTDDPTEVERRWVEFDEWAEQYEQDELGELYGLTEDG